MNSNNDLIEWLKLAADILRGVPLDGETLLKREMFTNEDAAESIDEAIAALSPVLPEDVQNQLRMLRRQCSWQRAKGTDRDNGYPYRKHLPDCDICRSADLIERLVLENTEYAKRDILLSDAHTEAERRLDSADKAIQEKLSSAIDAKRKHQRSSQCESHSGNGCTACHFWSGAIAAYGEILGKPGITHHDAIAALSPVLPDQCEHEWIDPSNEAVDAGEYRLCLKCRSIAIPEAPVLPDEVVQHVRHIITIAATCGEPVDTTLRLSADLIERLARDVALYRDTAARLKKINVRLIKQKAEYKKTLKNISTGDYDKHESQIYCEDYARTELERIRGVKG